MQQQQQQQQQPPKGAAAAVQQATLGRARKGSADALNSAGHTLLELGAQQLMGLALSLK
jgi:hypothetical protein